MIWGEYPYDDLFVQSHSVSDQGLQIFENTTMRGNEIMYQRSDGDQSTLLDITKQRD